MSTIANKLDALFAMGYTADEIACIARQQEKERNAAMNLAERAKARDGIIKAFDAYHKTLGVTEDIPKEVWDEVFNEYEKGLAILNEHADDFAAALNELGVIFGFIESDEEEEDDEDDWTVISEDELKEELKRKVKEFCRDKYK